MRYKFIILFLILGFVSKAQVYQLMPQYGYSTYRMNFDSTIQIPTFCGVPKLGSNKINKGALAFDSCNNRFYFFNPKSQAWDTIKSGSTIDTTKFVRYTDTAQFLLPYLRKIDTTNRFVSSVTKLNDSTIQVIKGTTTSNITISSVTSATRLITQVWNNTGATILRGSVVYISGRHSSNLPTIALAEGNNESNSYKTFALVDGDIADNSSGFVIQAGKIVGLNLPTSSYTDGDILYLSPTVAGGYTTTKPLAPNHIVKLGSVTRAHPTQGSIEIKIENGWQLDELSDVQIAAIPADSTLLQFSRVDSLWHDVSPLTAIGNRYLKPTDSISLSNRINLKLNISDTANMLNPYLRKIDTTNRFVTSVFRKTASDSVFFVRGGNNNFAFRDSTGAAGWGLLGNSGTNATTNFIGTTDNVNLVFRRNNVISGRIDSTNANSGITTFGFRATATGTNNTSFGWKSLQNSTGDGNVAFGSRAGRDMSNGTENTFVGESAGRANISGTRNVCIGAASLVNSTTGGSNVSIGSYSMINNSSGNNNIAIGGVSGFYNTTASNQIFINSIDRNNYSGDQTGSPFYAQQNSTVTNQIVTLNGRVGINTISPSASAGLEVSSTTQGFLQPRLTTTQMNAISTPATGLSVFNTTDSVPYVYRGTGGGWSSNVMTTGNQTINGQKTFNDILFIASGSAIRGNGNFFIDGPGLGGTISYRAATHNMTGNLTGLTSILTGALTVNGGTNTASIITGSSGVTSLQITNTKSGGGTWYFENNRNAAAGSLEISNSTSTPALTLFPSRNVSIGSNTEVASARLNVESTTQGFMPPRMTTTQRDLISSPAAGLIIYNTTTNKHQGYNGTTWNDFY